MLLPNKAIITILAILTTIVTAVGGQSSKQIPLSQAGNEKLTQNDFASTRDSTFSFDIDWHHGSQRLVINEVIDRSRFLAISGDVDFVQGDLHQERDVVVLVRMSSLSAGDLDHLFARAEGQDLIIGSIPVEKNVTAALTLRVVVFVKPHCLQMGLEGTIVETVNLNINIRSGLWFETYKMNLTTHNGIIRGSEISTFTAHEITVRAKHGHIVGNWSLPSAIRLITHVGNIDVDLIPKRWSSGPGTRGDIHAEANRGDVTIRMPFDREKLSLRNGSTTIQSVGGKISGTLVHSASTRILSQWYGSINLTLLPYWSFSEWQGIQYNHLRTDQFGGDTNLRILPPIIESYFPANPLCLMKSYHKTIIGQMNISYPQDWCGRMTGNVTIGTGHIEVTGKNYEVLVQERDYVVIQRRPLGSQLDLDVVNGYGHLELR